MTLVTAVPTTAKTVTIVVKNMNLMMSVMSAFTASSVSCLTPLQHLRFGASAQSSARAAASTGPQYPIRVAEWPEPSGIERGCSTSARAGGDWVGYAHSVCVPSVTIDWFWPTSRSNVRNDPGIDEPASEGESLMSPGLDPTSADDLAYGPPRSDGEVAAQQVRIAGRVDQRGRARDERGRASDARAAALAQTADASEKSLIRQLEDLGAQARSDRAAASADRAQARQDRADAEVDRATAARELARVEGELRTAHLDDLTGAYRREVGRLALTHEIDRARRSDGRFVLVFVDVDGLKIVNDRDGHAAGDRVLEAVVREIRMQLRSYDLIIRYGGDEFVCGLSGTDIAETARRFDAIGVAIKANAGVGISVGLAALGTGDTLDQLTERADAAMLEVKGERR